MTPNRFLRAVRRRWLVLLSSTVGAAVLALAVMASVSATYSATATLRIGTAALDGAGMFDVQYTERFVNTYQELLEQPRVLADVERDVERLVDGEVSLSDVAIDVPVNSELLSITVASVDPAAAAAGANALADRMVRAVADWRAQQPAPAQIGTEVTHRAVAPRDPDGPPAPAVVGLAALLGLALGAVLVWLAERWDPRIQEPEDAAVASGLRHLGHVDHDSAADTAPGASTVSAAMHLMRSSPSRILVGSAGAEDVVGAVQALVRALSAAGHRVLVLDADVGRRPLVQRWQHFGGDARTTACRTRDAGVRLLSPTSWPHVVDALALRSGGVKDSSTATQPFDVVVVSAPGLAVGPQALLLAPQVDAVVLLAITGTSRRTELARAGRQLAAVGSAASMVVLTSSGGEPAEEVGPATPVPAGPDVPPSAAEPTPPADGRPEQQGRVHKQRKRISLPPPPADATAGTR